MVKNNIYIYIYSCLFIVLTINAIAQNKYNIVEGKISYVNNKHVYVKFQNTENIKIGDSIYIKRDDSNLHFVIVENKSSLSCLAKIVLEFDYKVGDEVYIKLLNKEFVQTIDTNKQDHKLDQSIIQIKRDTLIKIKMNSKRPDSIHINQKINGRIYLSNSGDFGDGNNFKNTRLRLSSSMNVYNIGGSKFSLETYLNYRHRYGVDQQYGFNDDFKVYALALQYDIHKNHSIWFGRRINNNLSNMGAIDGLQYEYKLKSFQFGILAGYRPDIFNYSLNTHQHQLGFFVSHLSTKKQFIQTSIAFVNQNYYGKTDRRFMYLQHNNNITKNINLFSSLEFDLFQSSFEKTTSTLRFTSFYSSIRYRITKRWSIGTTYDNRKNIVYNESYRDSIYLILAQQNRQGLRLQTNVGILKNINLNLSAFYRFEKDLNSVPSNYYANLSYVNIPKIKSSMYISWNNFQNPFVKGNIYSFKINKDLFKNKLNIETGYKKLQYHYLSSDQVSLGDEISLNLNYTISRFNSILLSLENNHSGNYNNYRYYITLMQRIKTK